MSGGRRSRAAARAVLGAAARAGWRNNAAASAQRDWLLRGCPASLQVIAQLWVVAYFARVRQ
eukprot:13837509-Alexandrium_andersonii.AAC.1